MLPLDTLLTFIFASLALCITPGPDNLFVLAQSASHGSRAGILVTLGLCTGLVGHTAAVALGVAIIFKTSPLAFTALKIVGATYLLYLAWQAFKSSISAAGQSRQIALSGVQLYRRGIFMNITNPKVSIFFLAFLPQFADPALGSVSAQIISLGLAFIMCTLLIFGGVALLAGTLGDWLRRSPRMEIYLNRVAGLVFVGLAARLILGEHAV